MKKLITASLLASMLLVAPMAFADEATTTDPIIDTTPVPVVQAHHPSSHRHPVVIDQRAALIQSLLAQIKVLQAEIDQMIASGAK